MNYLLIIAPFISGIIIGFELKKNNASTLRKHISLLDEQNKDLVDFANEVIELNNSLALQINPNYKKLIPKIK